MFNVVIIIIVRPLRIKLTGGGRGGAWGWVGSLAMDPEFHKEFVESFHNNVTILSISEIYT